MMARDGYSKFLWTLVTENQFLIEQPIMLHRLEILSHCKMTNDKGCE